MKTWEMIKELTENPNKKFISGKGEQGNEMIAERNMQNIEFRYLDKSVRADCIAVTRKWEEVKESVDFMTAVESGKRIKVEHRLTNEIGVDDLITFSPLDCLIFTLGDIYQSKEVRDIIENGKWYIED